jgi:hypothetical protein
MRRSKSIETLLPILYLKGISTGDFSEALAALMGFDQAPVPALSMLLVGEGNQSRYDTPGYEVLHHGCHSR